MDTMPPSLPPTLPPPRRTPGLAVASLVLGILSVLGGSILILPTLLAIIFGHIAYARIRKDASLGGSGLAVAGFVLGYVSIVFGIFTFGLLAAMAIPAFAKVREQSLHNAMRNEARQIAAAAQQVMLEEGKGPVIFQIDAETGEISGPIATYVSHVTPGTQAVDGVIEHDADGFSLQNPHVRGGAVVRFDAIGREQ